MSDQRTHQASDDLVEGRNGPAKERAPNHAEQGRQTTSQFNRLPHEVRNQIYAYVLDDISISPNPIRLLGMNITGDLNPQYALFFVNQELRIEVGTWYLNNKTIDIWATSFGDIFLEYLDSFPDQDGYEAVRSIAFPQFYREGWETPNPNVELLLRLPKLHMVSISFHRSYLLDTLELHLGLVVALRVIIEKYSLGDMLLVFREDRHYGRQRLVVRLYRPSQGGFRVARDPELDTGPEALLEMLREWFVDGFRGVGREIVVEFVRMYNAGF
ncbi:hypothetical protein CC80DRAFT_497980 [Byssothecium circinans]|uniref:F-box domain-containing protein n=1 Tax=Byssothecium circinans TaxID=147558 RepID=A0A6A5TAR6_9PLEO|nr:hypothetical protein CC80DRAFT_497980 [Byssothecium circinans]